VRFLVGTTTQLVCYFSQASHAEALHQDFPWVAIGEYFHQLFDNRTLATDWENVG
jgi:hypothetical protein